MSRKRRSLFFDISRIVCVSLIVYTHYGYVPVWYLNRILFQNGWLFLVYPTSIAMIAVYGLIFVSGAVLELNYDKVASFSEYVKFVSKRCIRLYPAFWMSLILGLILVPSLLHEGFSNIVLEFSGFYVWLGMGNQQINVMGWFIGTIIPLYFLFPVLSRYIKEKPLETMGVLTAITFISRYYFLNYSPYQLAYRFLPICNLFEFGLGIYLVQQNLYPKNIGEHPIISELSEYTFYVFLFHFIVIRKLGPIIYMPFPGIGPLSYYDATYVLIAAEFLFISGLAMILDKKFQKVIRSKMFG